MRKKLWGITILAACLAFIIGFLAGHDAGRSTVPDVVYPSTFYATVTEVSTHSLKVEGLEINQINYRSLYRFPVDEQTQLVWRGIPVELSDFRPGLTVSVSFTGKILETYPVGLTEVCRVEILDDDFR